MTLEKNFYPDSKLSQIFSPGDSPITLFTHYSGLSYYLFIFVVKCGTVKLIKAKEWGLASYAFLFLKTDIFLFYAVQINIIAYLEFNSAKQTNNACLQLVIKHLSYRGFREENKCAALFLRHWAEYLEQNVTLALLK